MTTERLGMSNLPWDSGHWQCMGGHEASARGETGGDERVTTAVRPKVPGAWWWWWWEAVGGIVPGGRSMRQVPPLTNKLSWRSYPLTRARACAGIAASDS